MSGRIEKEKDAIIKKFNNSLRKLLKCVEQVTNDSEIEKARMAAGQALAINDLIAINQMGPYLFKYKEKIFAGDVDYFLEADLSKEITTSDSSVSIDSIIPKIRTAWKKCNEDEQSALYDIIHTMTTLYIEYVLLEKS